MAARGEEALRVAERAGSETSRLETMQLIALKQLCYGELAAGRDGLDEVIRRARSINHNYEAHKYIAVAHRLLGQVAGARGDLDEAEREFTAALDELRKFPMPVVEWKTHAAIGRLKIQSGDSVAAREAFAEAGKIIESIATNVKEEKLREKFLTSAKVRELVNGAIS